MSLFPLLLFTFGYSLFIVPNSQKKKRSKKSMRTIKRELRKTTKHEQPPKHIIIVGKRRRSNEEFGYASDDTILGGRRQSADSCVSQNVILPRKIPGYMSDDQGLADTEPTPVETDLGMSTDDLTRIQDRTELVGLPPGGPSSLERIEAVRRSREWEAAKDIEDSEANYVIWLPRKLNLKPEIPTSPPGVMLRKPPHLGENTEDQFNHESSQPRDSTERPEVSRPYSIEGPARSSTISEEDFASDYDNQVLILGSSKARLRKEEQLKRLNSQESLIISRKVKPELSREKPIYFDATLHSCGTQSDASLLDSYDTLSASSKRLLRSSSTQTDLDHSELPPLWDPYHHGYLLARSISLQDVQTKRWSESVYTTIIEPLYSNRISFLANSSASLGELNKSQLELCRVSYHTKDTRCHKEVRMPEQVTITSHYEVNLTKTVSVHDVDMANEKDEEEATQDLSGRSVGDGETFIAETFVKIESPRNSVEVPRKVFTKRIVTTDLESSQSITTDELNMATESVIVDDATKAETREGDIQEGELTQFAMLDTTLNTVEEKAAVDTEQTHCEGDTVTGHESEDADSIPESIAFQRNSEENADRRFIKAVQIQLTQAVQPEVLGDTNDSCLENSGLENSGPENSGPENSGQENNGQENSSQETEEAVEVKPLLTEARFNDFDQKPTDSEHFDTQSDQEPDVMAMPSPDIIQNTKDMTLEESNKWPEKKRYGVLCVPPLKTSQGFDNQDGKESSLLDTSAKVDVEEAQSVCRVVNLRKLISMFEDKDTVGSRTTSLSKPLSRSTPLLPRSRLSDPISETWMKEGQGDPEGTTSTEPILNSSCELQLLTKDQRCPKEPSPLNLQILEGKTKFESKPKVQVRAVVSDSGKLRKVKYIGTAKPGLRLPEQTGPEAREKATNSEPHVAVDQSLLSQGGPNTANGQENTVSKDPPEGTPSEDDSEEEGLSSPDLHRSDTSHGWLHSEVTPGSVMSSFCEVFESDSFDESQPTSSTVFSPPAGESFSSYSMTLPQDSTSDSDSGSESQRAKVGCDPVKSKHTSRVIHRFYYCGHELLDIINSFIERFSIFGGMESMV